MPITQYMSPVSANPSRMQDEKSRYGLPVYSAKEQNLDKWFKENKRTAGMVWGGGANDSPLGLPIGIVVNPYNESMMDKTKRESLYKNEAARVLMKESPVPDYKISPELQKWREKTFKGNEAYLTNDKAFRETVIARVISGDLGSDPKNPMPIDKSVSKIAGRYEKMLLDRDVRSQPNFFGLASDILRKPISSKPASYGKRPDGSMKGTGWLGEIKIPNGSVATEYTTQSQAVKVGGKQIDFPTLVPTLTQKEISLMKNDIIPNGKDIPEPIMRKAIDHAKKMIAEGKSVFAPTKRK